jgi:hypothetical protein
MAATTSTPDIEGSWRVAKAAVQPLTPSRRKFSLIQQETELRAETWINIQTSD